MDTLMNSIDTIKEKITDAEYKELCDKMMELNKQRKCEKKFYRVWYVSVETVVVENDDHEDEDNSTVITRYFPRFNNKIAKLWPKLVADKRSVIDQYGECVMEHKLLGVRTQAPLPVITPHGVHYIQSTDSDDCAVYRIDDLE
jgi:hypothetical protein